MLPALSIWFHPLYVNNGKTKVFIRINRLFSCFESRSKRIPTKLR